MNVKALPALIAFNVMLLLALVVTTLTPAPAQGQFAGANYIMVSGAVVGRDGQNAIYIIELNTARMVAVMYNSSSDNFERIDAVNMLDHMRMGN